MKVILSKEVPSLGQTGEVVKVKEGYARNFLLPKKLAYPATEANLKRIEQQQKHKQQENEKQKKEAQELAEKLNKVSCTVNVEVNDLDKLYGSISEVEISKALEVEGFNVDKNNILIDDPIGELGIFEIGVKLHSEVTAKVRLWVTKK